MIDEKQFRDFVARGQAAQKAVDQILRCHHQVDGGRCAGLEGHEGPCYANARDRATENG
jgi:hypothetical protein